MVIYYIITNLVGILFDRNVKCYITIPLQPVVNNLNKMNTKLNNNKQNIADYSRE